MNAPDERAHIELLAGQTKVAYEPDTRVQNAGTFVIRNEDHTLGNIVRYKLLEDPRVLFAAYQMPHPLENIMKIKVQVRSKKACEKLAAAAGNGGGGGGGGGEVGSDKGWPIKITMENIDKLQDEVRNISQLFKHTLEQQRAALRRRPSPDTKN